jgi:hypothetical protein
MIDILVIDNNDRKVGLYRSPISPRVGEILDANNGSWIVQKVQHDIRGSLSPDRITEEIPAQTVVVVYVVKCS